jgi:hypothetical protein
MLEVWHQEGRLACEGVDTGRGCRELGSRAMSPMPRSTSGRWPTCRVRRYGRVSARKIAQFHPHSAWRGRAFGRALQGLLGLRFPMGPNRPSKARSVHPQALYRRSTKRVWSERLAHQRRKAARARGRLGDRPPMPLDDPRIQTAKKLHADKSLGIADICKTLRISRPTLYRYVALKNAA